MKISRCKDANKISLLKKGLKGMNLSSLGINSAVYVNHNSCTYYKMLWDKCRKLFLNKHIRSFWVTNSTIKLKIVENGRVYAITQRNDLVELFPDNEILADQVYAARHFLNFLKSCYICVLYKFLELLFLFSFQVTYLELTVNNALFSHFIFPCRFILCPKSIITQY